ncbi:hypothetical protein [Teichococcus aestuarii]|uniref:Uncharacterized protein n=1 Tax=Teichococcus aestuarii TaxID=568898 RepID=A0A2U1V9V0_9PROT|nr:hypothetical protein [Pseudoroseomonas aestuarii]PWC30664.1 hypothetical protein CR165_01800 [Pseudoroseomonas aestuarii]
MAIDSIVPLTTRSAADSPSYALRAALAERLAAHRQMAREAGAVLTQLRPRPEVERDRGMALMPAKVASAA